MKFIAETWVWLCVVALMLIPLRKNGLQDLKEYAMLLYTCNILSGLVVLIVAYTVLPFTIIESVYRIIKENKIR